jgi:hypothetical protein
MTSPVSPARSPRSYGQLQKAMREYADVHDLAEGRVRNLIAYMALGGALEACGVVGDGGYFSFRGGVALELRRRGLARATKDIDVTYTGPESDMVRVIEAAVAAPYGRFTFRRTGQAVELPNANTVRMEISVRFDNDPWTTVKLDVSPRERHALEIERVPAFDLMGNFGVVGPSTLPCLSTRYQVAHKLHGMTAEREGGQPNDRVRDATDVLLYRHDITDLVALREACVDVFTSRGRHTWPPTFAPPGSWAPVFARLAEEMGLNIELSAAVQILNDFIEAIDKASGRGATASSQTAL